MRSLSSQVNVYKNVLIKRAINELTYPVAKETFSGPTILINVEDDIASVAKALTAFEKSHDALEIKSGLLEGKELTKATIIELSKLPSMNELIGTVVGTFKAPLNQLVVNLSSPIRGLVYVLDAIKLNK